MSTFRFVIQISERHKAKARYRNTKKTYKKWNSVAASCVLVAAPPSSLEGRKIYMEQWRLIRDFRREL